LPRAAVTQSIRLIITCRRLGPKCQVAFTAPLAATKPPAAAPSTEGGIEFFVDSVKGKDDQPFAPDSGLIDKPFKTIRTAVEATRVVRSTSPGAPATVSLRKGSHYLRDTITLTETDNGLTIAAYQDEQVDYCSPNSGEIRSDFRLPYRWW